jgi:hypothetical protein
MRTISKVWLYEYESLSPGTIKSLEAESCRQGNQSSEGHVKISRDQLRGIRGAFILASVRKTMTTKHVLYIEEKPISRGDSCFRYSIKPLLRIPKLPTVYSNSETRLHMPRYEARVDKYCLFVAQSGRQLSYPPACPFPRGSQLLTCLVPRNRFLHLPSRTHCSAFLRLVIPGEATTWALKYGVQQFVAILY